MFRKGAKSTRPRRSSSARSSLLLVVALLVVPGGVAACSADHSAGPTPAVGVSGTHAMANGMEMTTAEMDATWAARPAYTRANQRLESAYAYAMRSWNVIQWMPCYCGCDSLGHGSNLDCYFKPMATGSTKVSFEEHASFCDICVDITQTARKMAGEGKSLREIRQAVDRTYGSSGPGTTTALPPS
jgi:hypothetical protein